MKISPCRAFNIIALMVIVAVLGIVIAMAVPAHLRSGEIRHARTCQENLARIDAAVDAYALDNLLSGNAPVAINDLVKSTGTKYLQQIPICPDGGTYTVRSIDTPPICSVGPNQNATYAPHIHSLAIPAR